MKVLPKPFEGIAELLILLSLLHSSASNFMSNGATTKGFVVLAL
jgi:hypothetical protein